MPQINRRLESAKIISKKGAENGDFADKPTFGIGKNHKQKGAENGDF